MCVCVWCACVHAHACTQSHTNITISYPLPPSPLPPDLSDPMPGVTGSITIWGGKQQSQPCRMQLSATIRCRQWWPAIAMETQPVVSGASEAMAFTIIIIIVTNHRGGGVHSEGYCSCPVCMCVYVLICRLTHWNYKSEGPMDSSEYRNDFKNGDLAKNALFKSYDIICLPRISPNN